MLLKKFFLNIIRRFDNLIYDNFGPTRIIFLVRNQLGWQCLLPILKKLIDRPGIKIAVTVEFEGCFNFPKEEEEARLFNKFSRDFQKEYKVDTAIIDFTPGEKIDSSSFIKNIKTCVCLQT